MKISHNTRTRPIVYYERFGVPQDCKKYPNRCYSSSNGIIDLKELTKNLFKNISWHIESYRWIEDIGGTWALQVTYYVTFEGWGREDSLGSWLYSFPYLKNPLEVRHEI
jgi:hypothetical protein